MQENHVNIFYEYVTESGSKDIAVVKIPGGGISQGIGFVIAWQHGPRGQDENGNLKLLTGAIVEHILESVLDRLHFYQDSEFSCDENDVAIQNISSALKALYSRRKDRSSKKIEGTNKLSPSTKSNYIEDNYEKLQFVETGEIEWDNEK